MLEHLQPSDVDAADHSPQRSWKPGRHVRRDELGVLIERDLLGPWDGATEQFAPNAAPGAVPGRDARSQARGDVYVAQADEVPEPGCVRYGR